MKFVGQVLKDENEDITSIIFWQREIAKTYKHTFTVRDLVHTIIECFQNKTILDIKFQTIREGKGGKSQKTKDYITIIPLTEEKAITVSFSKTHGHQIEKTSIDQIISQSEPFAYISILREMESRSVLNGEFLKNEKEVENKEYTVIRWSFDMRSKRIVKNEYVTKKLPKPKTVGEILLGIYKKSPYHHKKEVEND